MCKPIIIHNNICLLLSHTWYYVIYYYLFCSVMITNYLLIAGANKDWDAYIHTKLSRWPQQTVNLLFEAKLAKCPVYILVFEDLRSDTAGEMKRVTDFLGFSYTLEEVSARLKAGYSHFYRNHTAHFPHFTPDQEQYIHSVVKATSQFMKKEDLYSMFPRIDDYL